MEPTPKRARRLTREELTPLTPTAFVAVKMAELRADRGWSAEQLAAKMRAAGVGWTRLVVTKLEKGYRQSVSVEELLALAYVLDVAPVHLMIPSDDNAPCWVTAHHTQSARHVRQWVRGWPHSAGLPGTDPKRYLANTPASEDDVHYVPDEEYQALVSGSVKDIQDNADRTVARAIAAHKAHLDQEKERGNG